MKTPSADYSLSPAPLNSTRAGRLRLDDPRLPGGTYQTDVEAAFAWNVRDARVRDAVGAVNALAGAVLRRAVRVGAILGAPVHGLAAMITTDDARYSLSRHALAAACGLRAVSRWVEGERGTRFEVLADILVTAADISPVLQHRARESYERAVRRAADLVALHDLLDTLATEKDEAHTVLRDSSTGGLIVCTPHRAGKTFVEYALLDGTTLRAEAKGHPYRVV